MEDESVLFFLDKWCINSSTRWDGRFSWSGRGSKKEPRFVVHVTASASSDCMSGVQVVSASKEFIVFDA